ncbi:hypothetical protein [Flavobacterium pedocola]
MKNFLLLLMISLFISCQKEETEEVTYELLPVTEVNMPNTFRVNQMSNIQVKFVRPTDCHSFNKFYSQKNNGLSKVAVESIIVNSSGKSCPTLNGNGTTTSNFKFTPEEAGEYTLQFWKGKNNSGEDTFLTYNIEITE